MLTILEIPFGTPAFDESVRLRYDILREPLGLGFEATDISEEYRQIHLGGYNENMELIACLVLNPIEAENATKMRQVAVVESHQRKGLGTLLVAESEKVAKEKGFVKMVMSARLTAVPFYERLGYKKLGRKYIEVTVPHYKMQKDL